MIKILSACEENGFEVFTEGEYDTIDEARTDFIDWYGEETSNVYEDVNDDGYEEIAMIVTDTDDEVSFCEWADDKRMEMLDEL